MWSGTWAIDHPPSRETEGVVDAMLGVVIDVFQSVLIVALAVVAFRNAKSVVTLAEGVRDLSAAISTWRERYGKHEVLRLGDGGVLEQGEGGLRMENCYWVDEDGNEHRIPDFGPD